jgi:hypothetical protein
VLAAGTDVIDTEGILKLYTDLGISLEDVLTILLPYYFKMDSPVLISKESLLERNYKNGI